MSEHRSFVREKFASIEKIQPGIDNLNQLEGVFGPLDYHESLQFCATLNIEP